MAENFNNSIEFFYSERLGVARDSLTQVLDRQTMVEYMEWLIDKNIPFSFFFIDVDNFKNVNDTYGHLAGDAVLTAVARYLEKECDGRGAVGRYGGDEFILILPNVTDFAEVRNIGNEISTGLSGLKAESVQDLTLTLSMGISRFPEDASNYDGIVGLADKVLYRAKMSGRNRFIIYEHDKHSKINMRETTGAKFSAMQLCSRLYDHLTAYGEDIAVGIANLLKHIVAYYIFDRICVQDRERINLCTIYERLDSEYDYIPRAALGGVINKFGYAILTDAAVPRTEYQHKLLEELRRQKIKSAFVCEISAYDKHYGYLRVDTVKRGRIWQEGEMSMLVSSAKAIGLILYYQKKKLEELPLYPVTVVCDN